MVFGFGKKKDSTAEEPPAAAKKVDKKEATKIKKEEEAAKKQAQKAAELAAKEAKAAAEREAKEAKARAAEEAKHAKQNGHSYEPAVNGGSSSVASKSRHASAVSNGTAGIELAALQEANQELEDSLQLLKADYDRMKDENTKMAKENFEMANSFGELKSQMQQSAALKSAKDKDDFLYHGEIKKLKESLEDERRMTEKLSRNLELERRRNESLEQKLKRRSSNTTSILDDIRIKDDRVLRSMEKFQNQCESLTSILEECEERLSMKERNSANTTDHAGGLFKELNQIKRLVYEERQRSLGESQQFGEAQNAFGQVLNDYISVMENIGKAASEVPAVLEDFNQAENIKASLESIRQKLSKAEDALREERLRCNMLEEKVKQASLDAEAIPILRAQVDVYQCDFKQERAAREKIAGEKADLEEELRKLRQKSGGTGGGLGASSGVGMAIGGSTSPVQKPQDPGDVFITNQVRDQVNRFNKPTYGAGASESASVRRGKEPLTCPFCKATFANLEPLEQHVNYCIDNQK